MLVCEIEKHGFDIEMAGAANAKVVRALTTAMQALGLVDQIEDIPITLRHQLHLIRPLAANPSLFVCLALDSKKANLSVAQIALKNVEVLHARLPHRSTVQFSRKRPAPVHPVAA